MFNCFRKCRDTFDPTTSFRLNTSNFPSPAYRGTNAPPSFTTDLSTHARLLRPRCADPDHTNSRPHRRNHCSSFFWTQISVRHSYAAIIFHLLGGSRAARLEQSQSGSVSISPTGRVRVEYIQFLYCLSSSQRLARPVFHGRKLSRLIIRIHEDAERLA
jgi:hypothetical protein